MDPTVSSAPWWYVAALAGGFTILGGVITLAGGYFGDRRKFKHEDKMRWAENIRDLCAQLISNDWEVSAFRLERVGRDLAHVRGEIGANMELIYKDLSNKELRAIDAQLRVKEAEAIKDDTMIRAKSNENLRVISELKLLAPDDVVEAAEYFVKVRTDSKVDATYHERIKRLSLALHKQLGV